MSKIAIATDRAPSAIGPYSQAISTGSMMFLSGQIPIDPASGALVSSDVSAQTEQVMKNLAAVLEAGGLSFKNVVKTTIYLTDLNDFQAVNTVYGSFFQPPPPARATVEVAALPKGSRVEIDAVACS